MHSGASVVKWWRWWLLWCSGGEVVLWPVVKWWCSGCEVVEMEDVVAAVFFVFFVFFTSVN